MLIFDFILIGFITYAKIHPKHHWESYKIRTNNSDGGSADDFSRYLRTIQRMRNELPPAVKCAIKDHMMHDLIIPSLKSHSDLSGIHTLLRAEFSDNPQEIALSLKVKST